MQRQETGGAGEEPVGHQAQRIALDRRGDPQGLSGGVEEPEAPTDLGRAGPLLIQPTPRPLAHRPFERGIGEL
jgi:hypothetical protein